MLNNCCNKFDLGVFAHSEDKTFSQLIAPDTGYYFFELHFLGVVKKIRVQHNAGDVLSIPSWEYMSEDQMFTLQIKTPDGSYLSYAYTECFTFRTVYSIEQCNPCNDLPYGLTHPYSHDDDSSAGIGTM